ncbi:MAG: aldo/keto reductase [Candidatus Aminicenantes bacterium]|nr:MAG: aldo/keto reductase [Candidatus Aminicenantes bacterium]
MKKHKGKMSRKEFLHKSSVAFLGLGFLGISRKTTKAKETSKAPSGPLELGKTGIKVSPVGFGASRTMEPSLVNAAIDAGFNFLDTGRSYSRGQNEVMVGEVVAPRRKDVVIQSKLRVRLQSKEDGMFAAEDVKKAIDGMTASMEASLKALRTDYIDIMLIHGASDPKIIYHEPVMAFFEKAQQTGKIRAYGFSCHSNQVELLRVANKKKFYEVIMVPYNHKGSYIHMNSGSYSEWDQPALEIEMDKAKKHGVGMIGMKTCSGGPYSPDEKTEPSFEHALRWILAQDKVHTMAVAMGNFEQIEENRRVLS